MDNKNIEFFDFDEEFNLDDLDFKKTDVNNQNNNIEIQNNNDNINSDILNTNIDSSDDEIKNNDEAINLSTQDSTILIGEDNNISEPEKKEELENPVVEMINNKTTMKLIITILIVLFLAVLFMPKVFELLNKI